MLLFGLPRADRLPKEGLRELELGATVTTSKPECISAQCGGTLYDRAAVWGIWLETELPNAAGEQ